ncbi:MAG: LON peptidase substrate-binding domain-containing protein, partial [Chloroflexota bacterium]
MTVNSELATIAAAPAELSATPEAESPEESPFVTLPLLPRWDTVVFPNMVGQIVVRNERSQRALEHAANTDSHILVVARRNPPPQEISLENLYEVGTEAAVGRIIRLPDGLMNVWVQGIRRIKLEEVLSPDGGFFEARGRVLEERPARATGKTEVRMRAMLNLFEKYVRLSDKVPEEAYVIAMNAKEPGPFTDIIAGALTVDLAQQQELLEMLDQRRRLTVTGQMLAQELDVLELQQRIRSEVQDGIDKSQKEFYIREQMRVLQKELGQMDPIQREAEEFREKLDQSGMPEVVQKRVEQELDRLAAMPSAHPEVTMVRNYLDWMVHLPWKVDAEGEVDIREAQRVLYQNHYGLPKVKERIIEYIAVRKLAQERLRSPILCFVGPPGVGKTSLGMSIAQALGRKFVRVSLGGIRDEAEVRGHRRTYVGALPGRIIQTIRTAGTINPVFMLDELDKVGTDFRGDPSSALLEVLDPEQNHTFSDHYLEVPYDLSKVFFIATANLLEPIIPALRDR